MDFIKGLIATPFGYLLSGLYALTSNYGLALVLFAIAVQAILAPLALKNKRSKEKKRRLQPVVEQIRAEHKDDIDKQADLIAELYKKEKVSLVGNFIFSILPFIILISVFQAVAQPITYLFRETSETATAIISVLRQEAPELFASSYNQVNASAHIQEFAEIVKARVPEVSARTLEGLNYNFLGLDLTVVPGLHILGKGTWAWDWAHIGAVLLPVVYMARRFYCVFSGMFRSLADYMKKKKLALENNQPAPKMPNPPLLSLFFLLLSLSALFAVPIAMNVYWLASGLAGTGINKLIAILTKKAAKNNAPETVA